MAASFDPLETVETIADALDSRGFEPVLIGGMALVILGSRRVTRDFDFLVSTQGRVQELVAVMYRHGLRLATKLDAAGDVARTIDNPRVAAAKVKAETPTSLFFSHEGSGLRVDLLLDHPFPAQTLRRRAVRVKLKSRKVSVAAPEDLLKMKEIAHRDRGAAGDAEDLHFLRKLLSKERSP